MHSVRIEPTELILHVVGTRITYQATGDAGGVNFFIIPKRPWFVCYFVCCIYEYELRFDSRVVLYVAELFFVHKRRKNGFRPFCVLPTVFNDNSRLATPKRYGQSTWAPLLGVVVVRGGRLALLVLLRLGLVLPSTPIWVRTPELRFDSRVVAVSFLDS